MTKHTAFDGLASYYDRYRPDYPEEIFAKLCNYIKQGISVESHNLPLVLDVGSGTGISTRLLRQHLGPAFTIVGIEPGQDMLQQAIKSTQMEADITYVNAHAESLPYDDCSVTGIVVAQAIQWFDRSAFYAEARRLLQNGGTLAILQNNRNWRENPFLEEYETFLEKNGEKYSRFYRSFDLPSELAELEGFVDYMSVATSWERDMDRDDFIGMTLSSTKMQAVVDRLGKAEATQQVRQIAQKYVNTKKKLVITYQCELFLARRLRVT